MPGSLQGVPTAIALSKATIGNLDKTCSGPSRTTRRSFRSPRERSIRPTACCCRLFSLQAQWHLSSVCVLGNALRLRGFVPPSSNA
jgi:hypothetical protein